MPTRLRDSVIVITGASSGIGRATALACARQGATVVVSARKVQALETLAAQCEHAGGHALAISADVNDQDALARETVTNFGRIDVWLNNAGVTAAGRFEALPPDVFRQVMETNFFGTVNGTRAVLPYFREQGSGNLINIASVQARIGASHFSAYCASKFAVVGFTETIRQELRDTGIDVCLVLPAAIDTPLFSQAANFSGKKIQPLNPVYPPEMVARTIVGLIKHPRPEAIVGNAGKAVVAAHRIIPYALSDRIIARQWETKHFQPQPDGPTRGNLFEPDPAYTTVSGGWPSTEPINGKFIAAGLAATMIPAAILWRRNTESRSDYQSRLVQQLNAVRRQGGKSIPALGTVIASKLPRVKFWR